MKKVLFYILLSFLVNFLMGCVERTELTPANPIIGRWHIYTSRVYNLPAWYITEFNVYKVVTPTDTIYSSNSLDILFNINYYTFAEDSTFTELYQILYTKPNEPGGRTDKGTWTMTDSVVRLTAANNFPKKLIYNARTDQIYTEVFPQTSTFRVNSGSRDSVTVSYNIRLYYRRSP